MTPFELATCLYRPEDDGSPAAQFSPTEQDVLVIIDPSGRIGIRVAALKGQQSYSVLLTPSDFRQICQWFLFRNLPDTTELVSLYSDSTE